MDAYNSTATTQGVPNHVSLNYPQTCDNCHDTSSWATATFNHNTTTFPLTGAHTSVACALCHTDNYAGTLPTVCSGCHMTDYQSTSNMIASGVPDHVANSTYFPTTCDTCHTTTAWTGATFPNHTWFSIPHHASVCGDCHQVSSLSLFTCINCHTNPVHRGPPGSTGSTNDMNQHPNVMGGNWFGPTTCYQCHH
jgi:hypothetical protein